MPPVDHHKSAVRYWQSLEHLADTPEVRARIDNEFAGYDPSAIAGMSRRRFMKIMGASMALAGITLSGCRRWPREYLAPYVVRPQGRTPGVPEAYASVIEQGGVGTGVLVSSYDGRPIKIEGNPEHPFSLGAATAQTQASVLSMYDPERSRRPMQRVGRTPQESDWTSFDSAVGPVFARHRENGGAGLVILSEATSSPTVARLRDQLQQRMPQAKWVTYEACGRDNEIAGTRLAFGQSARPVLHLEKASVIVSLDSDLLGQHPAQLRYARDWAAGRKSADSQARMNRLWAIESSYTMTGSVADHRLPVRASRVHVLTAAIAARLGVPGVASSLPLDERESQFVDQLVADVRAHPSVAVFAAGDHQPPAVHALVAAINLTINAIGHTISYLAEPVVGDPITSAQALAELTASIGRGEVQTLLILGGDPLYTAPADVDFAPALFSVPVSIHLSHYFNQTSAACTWHANRAMYLESWGDARAWDGTISVCQPLIYPLHGGRSSIELLAMLLGEQADAHELVRQTFTQQLGLDEDSWRKVLHDGVVPNSAYPLLTPSLVAASIPQPSASAGEFDVTFIPDANLHDGRYAPNGWLMEAPRPMTKLVWDNAAILSKTDADRLRVAHGDMLRITVDGRRLEIAAFIMPGQPVGSITLPLGYGQQVNNSICDRIGFNTYLLRTTAGQGIAPARVEATGGRYQLVTTQDHHVLIDAIGQSGMKKRMGAVGEGGYIIREATLEEYRRNPRFAREGLHGHVTLQLWHPPHEFNDPHAWGMTIDMSACIGCNACVVACQAENNVPIVGKTECANNREMHWLRVDRYFKSDPKLDPNLENPQVVHQVMMCVQCENAPCESVCPVAATVHDSEGLNTMVYNRCIGTRYCSNNCPYKVRRFNYFDFNVKHPRQHWRPFLGMPDQQQKKIDPVRQLGFNPEVTVRMRGVMEKCTYCTQRLAQAKINARNDWSKGRRESFIVQPGEVQTACQQTCPTQAIQFGDLNNLAWEATRQQSSNPRAYGVLAELNTRPRTLYLAKLRNPAS